MYKLHLFLRIQVKKTKCVAYLWKHLELEFSMCDSQTLLHISKLQKKIVWQLKLRYWLKLNDTKTCNNHRASVVKPYLVVLSCLLIGLHWKLNLSVCIHPFSWDMIELTDWVKLYLVGLLFFFCGLLLKCLIKINCSGSILHFWGNFSWLQGIVFPLGCASFLGTILVFNTIVLKHGLVTCTLTYTGCTFWCTYL